MAAGRNRGKDATVPLDEVADEQGELAAPRLLIAVVMELESRPEVEYAVPNELVEAS